MIKNHESLSDTIAAIATGAGESGIGIVRISGKDALKIADRIFICPSRKKPSGFKTFTTHYGWIVKDSQLTTHPSTRPERSRRPSLGTGNSRLNKPADYIDEVILTVMRAPRSYTKEDIVEINCHGGIVALRGVLETALKNGCRLAAPGEFTKRAFLNGRIDLAQAEAVLDIIRAKTDSALKLGIGQLKGELSGEISEASKGLLGILAVLEADIDFPEEQINPGISSQAQRLSRINNRLIGLLQSSSRARLLREGLRVVICGKPNVGKSSLLNALLKEERSIVTPVAGTTRDTIEEAIDIKGLPVRIVDTAGIIEPRDLVEKIAVKRAKKYIGLSDLAVIVFDGSRKLDRQDATLIRKLRGKSAIAVINKIDLRQRIERKRVFSLFKNVVEISAKKLKNINLLEEALVNSVCEGRAMCPEPAIVGNLRHISALREAQKLVAGALNSLDNKLSLEFTAQDIKEALGFLDSIFGKRVSEDLLDKIFNDFCIGK